MPAADRLLIKWEYLIIDGHHTCSYTALSCGVALRIACGHLHLLLQAVFVLIDHAPLDVGGELRQERPWNVVERYRRPDLRLAQMLGDLLDHVI